METALMAVQKNREGKQKGEGGGPGRGSWSRKFTAILLVVCMIMIAVGSATCAASTYNTANATMVTFTNSGVTAKGSYSDYEIDGTEFTITGSGTYVFSGSCSDGSIVVKKGLTDVTVVFNGLKLTSTTTAPFNAKSDTEVTLVLAAGTTNSLADTNRDAEKPKACLNSSGNLTITGSGSLTVSGNNKQGIKADGTLTVTGGKLTVSALKKALKADEKVVIGTEGGSDSDLSITVTSSSEGIESENVYFYSGTIDITSSNDGVNTASSDEDEASTTDTATAASTAATPSSSTSTAASADSSTSGSSDAGPQAGRMPHGGFGGNGGPGGESSGAGDYNIYIYGGDITVNANGDGLDSNGSIYMNSGNVKIWQTGNGDGALDYETACEVTGGTLLAAGSMGMAAAPTKTDDSQAYINFSASSAISSGSTISIKDASGNTVYTVKAPKSVQSVVFSSPKVTDGASYTLYEGSTQKASASATTESSGNGMGGRPGGFGGMQRPDGTNGGMTPPDGSSSGQPPQLSDGANSIQPGGFTDVAANSWYAQAVDFVTRSRLMSGTSTGVFSPDNAMTRAMLVTVLWRAEGQPTASSAASFTDAASDSWYSSAVAWTAENGIVNGTSDTTFSPDKSVTRQEIAAILQRYAKYKGADITQTADLSACTDNASVASWASDAMAWAVNKGVITGAASTTLAPSANATRAQVATMLMRYMQQ